LDTAREPGSAAGRSPLAGRRHLGRFRPRPCGIRRSAHRRAALWRGPAGAEDRLCRSWIQRERRGLVGLSCPFRRCPRRARSRRAARARRACP
jgi:hypothetical protein